MRLQNSEFYSNDFLISVVMRTLFTLVTVLFLSCNAIATQFTAIGNGNWNNTAKWDQGSVPGANDTVIIASGYSISVNIAASCKRLVMTNTAGVGSANNTTLTINSGYSLTVGGNMVQNVTVSNITVGACNVYVYGTLTVTGNYTQNHTLSVLGNANLIQVGDGSTAGTVNINGNVTMQNGFITALGNANKMLLANGTLDIDGNIVFQAGAINLLATNEINANDGGSYDNKTKSFYFAGNFSNTDQGTVTFTDGGATTAPYTFYYNGVSAQDLATQNIYYRNVTVNNSGAELNLVSNLSNTNFPGNITIASGAVLNTKSYNMDAITGSAGQISIASNGTLKVENSAGVPTQKVSGSYVCVPNTNGTVEFYSSSSLTVFDEDYDYTNVILSGSGTKTYSTTAGRQIDNSTTKVYSIHVTGGTFVIPDAKKLQLSSSGTKVVTMDAGTTLAIQGDFNTLDAKFDLALTSTVWYQKNGNQTVYALTNASSAAEPYGNLKLSRESGSGSVNRTIAASNNVKVEGKVTIESYAQLVISQSASLELVSDASNTAYIGEIASTSGITYSGSPAGTIICNKYVSLPDANYRDFASPIKNSTLATWKNAGMDLTGFIGSQYPNSAWVNAWYYDESDAATLNDGWVAASNVTNAVQTANGSNQVTNGSWRIYTGVTGGLTLSLSDAGEIQTGDIDFLCSFTHGSGDRTWDDGWNMMGNPYPAPLNWSKIYRDASNSSSFGSNGIQSTYYVWRPSDTGFPDDEEDSYGFFNAATGVGSNLDSIIPSHQGFWIKTYHASSNSTSYPLHVKESHKQDQGTTKFFKSGQGAAEGLVTVYLKSSQYTDKVWFHLWPDATVGADAQFDVDRFGNSSNFASINFSQDGEPLYLWVNALPYKAYTMEVPLYISSVSNDSLTLTFEDISKFVEAFGCVKLFDRQTGQTIDLSVDSAYTFWVDEGYAGERFLLQMTRTMENKISTQNSTCAAEKDGFIDVDLSEYPDDIDMSLFKNGVLVKNYTGDIDLIHELLGAGDYMLVNNLGEITCSVSTYTFSLTTGTPIIANFSAPATGYTHNPIQFQNVSSGAVQYVWDFGDGTATVTDAQPTHTFESVGVFTIQLSAYNENACEPDVTSRQVAIQSDASVTAIDPGDKFKVFTSDGGIVLSNLTTESGSVSVFTLDGKLILDQKLSQGNQTLNILRNNQIYIVLITTSEGSYQQKVLY